MVLRCRLDAWVRGLGPPDEPWMDGIGWGIGGCAGVQNNPACALESGQAPENSNTPTPRTKAAVPALPHDSEQ